MIEKYIAFTLFYFPMKTVILQQNVSLDLKYRITKFINNERRESGDIDF